MPQSVDLGLHVLLRVSISLHFSLLKEGKVGPDRGIALGRDSHGHVCHQGRVLCCIHFDQTMDRVILSWTHSRILSLLELLLDSLVSSFDLIRLTLKLIFDDFLFIELLNELSLFLSVLSSKFLFVYQPLLDVLNANRHRIAFIFLQKGLRGHISDRSFNVVTGFNSVLKLALNISDFLCL